MDDFTASLSWRASWRQLLGAPQVSAPGHSALRQRRCWNKGGQLGLSALSGPARRSDAWHSARHDDTAHVARRVLACYPLGNKAHDAEAATVCRALLVAAQEKFHRACSQDPRSKSVATVQVADNAPNVLRVSSSPPLLSAPLLQRAGSRQLRAECGRQTRHHLADGNTSLCSRALVRTTVSAASDGPFLGASVTAQRWHCSAHPESAPVGRACHEGVSPSCAPPGASGHQCRVHHVKRCSITQRSAPVGCWAPSDVQSAECIPRVGQTRRNNATRAAWPPPGVPSVRVGPSELALAVCQ